MRETYGLMEKRLYRIIMNNAAMAVFLLGFVLLWMNPSIARDGWFHIKLVLVLALLIYHIICGRILRDWIPNNKRSPRFYRIFNEVPGVLLILIVLLAVLKPF